jgi:hypothetical protein
MNIRILLSLVIIITAIYCSPGKKTAGATDVGSTVATDSVARRNTDLGSSFETAVLIKETTESAGVPAEYKWIREHYSGYKVVRQSLMEHKKTYFDVITIQLCDGKTTDVYFNISRFFK